MTLGLWGGGRFKDIAVYWAAQVLGAISGAGVLYIVASGATGFDPNAGFATNSFGEHSPGGYALAPAAACEVVMTLMFLVVTSKNAPAGVAPISIGPALTLIHLISIPATNTSVNPARSKGPVLFVGGWALEQLWLFWAAPLAGAVAGGLFSR